MYVHTYVHVQFVCMYVQYITYDRPDIRGHSLLCIISSLVIFRSSANPTSHPNKGPQTFRPEYGVQTPEKLKSTLLNIRKDTGWMKFCSGFGIFSRVPFQEKKPQFLTHALPLDHSVNSGTYWFWLRPHTAPTSREPRKPRT